ncbi:unnamed protein product [Peronospora destructor]|uniref:Uncharacterized protein n=1 Tax=Peronospora destructor TaxID=86335 RepID=A0AAV0T367_9STRA|nr:unnamed protein product [Peronospora destructor]
MLDTESPYVVRWTPDGEAFEIYDMVVITDYVLQAPQIRQLSAPAQLFPLPPMDQVTRGCVHFLQPVLPARPAGFDVVHYTLSLTKHLTSRSNVLKHGAQTPLVLPTLALQLLKQFDPVVTVQTAAQLEMLDGDASLA